MQLSKVINDNKSEILSEYSRRSFVNFIELINPSIEFTDFHLNYYKILDEFAKGNIKKLIITIPPQHGKSEASSKILPAYLLGINPNLWESGCLKLKIFDIPVEITFIKFGKPKNIFPVAAKLFS